MIAQWSARQIHDTVAAIARDPAYGGNRESLIGRLMRYLVREIRRILDWLSQSSLDARIVVYVTVAMVVLVVAGRVIAERRSADRRRRGLTSRGTQRERRDFWRVAGELAAGGQFGDASHQLYGAVLESLTAAQLVRFHASKTNGDYARELRRRGSPLSGEFLAFGRDFDRTVFGLAEPTRDDYERLRESAQRIVDALRARAA